MAATAIDIHALPRAKPATAGRFRDGRVLVGLLLALLVFAGGLLYWTLLAGPREVLTLGRDIPPGTPLAAADLVPSRVRVDGALAAQLFAAHELPSVLGQTAAQPLYAGELLMRPHLAQRPAPAPGLVVAAVPVKPETGPGPAAQPGSRVRVLATVGRLGGDAATTRVVLPEAEVAEVVYQPRSALLAGGETRAAGPSEPVVLRVFASVSEAEALAQAKVQGTLEVVLLGPGREAASVQGPP